MHSTAPPDRLATPLAKRLGISLPIVLPGMTRVSTPSLVAAVSEAGGLGLLATASLGPDDVRRAIRETRERTARPFGVNVPLLVPGARENLEVAVAERVPVVNYGLGNGGWCVPFVHNYGGTVIATVATLRHALAAERQGCDAVLAVGHEAAGHGGELGSLVFVPTLVDALSIPVVAAGGFADGRGLAAALVLGAQAAALGTRFATAAESPLHPNTKAAVIAAGGEDTLITDRLDGMPCRVLSAAGARHTAREGNGTLAALAASRASATRRGSRSSLECCSAARPGRFGSRGPRGLRERCGSRSKRATSSAAWRRRGRQWRSCARRGPRVSSRARPPPSLARCWARAAASSQGETPKLSLSLRRGSAPRKCGSRRPLG